MTVEDPQGPFVLCYDGSEAAERAMAQHPWVRSVEIRRRFPHGVNVLVSEHEPAAMVSFGDLYVVDLEGEPFKKLQSQDGVDVPLLVTPGAR